MADASTSSQSQLPLKVAPVRVRELPRLRQMFERAVRENFAYFSDEVQERVIREHALLQLAKARFDPRRVILVARRRGELAGYCIGAVPKTGPAQLFWLYVEPSHRGTNTGLSLLSRTLQRMERQGADDIYLATHDHRRYYERQGFKFSHHEQRHGVEMDIMKFAVRRAT